MKARMELCLVSHLTARGGTCRATDAVCCQPPQDWFRVNRSWHGVDTPRGNSVFITHSCPLAATKQTPRKLLRSNETQPSRRLQPSPTCPKSEWTALWRSRTDKEPSCLLRMAPHGYYSTRNNLPSRKDPLRRAVGAACQESGDNIADLSPCRPHDL